MYEGVLSKKVGIGTCIICIEKFLQVYAMHLLIGNKYKSLWNIIKFLTLYVTWKFWCQAYSSYLSTLIFVGRKQSGALWRRS